MFEQLRDQYSQHINALRIVLPNVNKIPVFHVDEAHEIIFNNTKEDFRGSDELNAREELLFCKIIKEQTESDFAFVTHYSSNARPFYAMDNPVKPDETLTFDLLFRGMEITTGGQRIHDFNTLVSKMQSRGMNIENLEHYLTIFKYGMPPHGGLAIGLERLTALLAGFENVRYGCLFPRDMLRLSP